ncbi:MAG: hypothetical protein JXX14_17885, partial [Deltaproteobacteria bacterium]|nr:hypothetical protein [Deltaproteobacteria bacterium]
DTGSPPPRGRRILLFMLRKQLFATACLIGNPDCKRLDGRILGHDGCFLNGKIRVIVIFQAKDLTYVAPLAFMSTEC